jgi:predicted ATPase/class 3 adenylate cyclase
VHGQSAVTTYLFTDIEGSTRLWEQEPERMRPALARHDELTRAAVEQNRGRIVKTTGDGFHAVFDDPLDALAATLQLQFSLTDPEATAGVPLRVRCGLHAGVDERRDNDFFGPVVNRAARIMNSAHGGQILVSQAVVSLIADRLPKVIAFRDLGRIRLRDLASSERIYQVLHPQLRHEFPALRSLEGTPNNLPQQVTTFVGREREQADVKAALRRSRLLTLSGIGGLGKTRLSLQVAAEVVSDFPDGVWFVELAPIADERLVPQAAATVLGVKEEAGQPVIGAMTKYLSDRTLLLVLDNCEHLVHACADLAKTLLQASPGVKILASSREHFNIAGETVYTVPPLPVPKLNDGNSTEAIVQFEAVRLFVERAMAAQPAFRLTEQNAPAVVEICQRLDGIPLALELAAARVRSLSVERIAERVSDRFKLLTTGDRTALPRQQTLRALIDWSFDLLTEKERVLFRRLSVFAGGWTLEAAEAVASDDEVDEAIVLDLLADLVDKSLVMVDAEGGRYGLLETVRQYAQERLADSREGEAMRKRHLDFYLTFAEKAGPGLTGPEQPVFLKQLDLDRENILAAHAYCVHTAGEIENGYRLVHAIKFYWFTRGLLNLGHRVTVEAISTPAAPATSLARCKALWVAGQLCSWMGLFDEAQKYLQESLEMARELHDLRMVVSVLNMLGFTALGLGDRSAARQHCEEALVLAGKLDNKRQIATTSNALAQIHRLDGELDSAESLYERAVALARDLGDRELAAVAFLNLAMVAIERGAADRARSLLLEVLAIAEQTGSKQAAQSALEVCAGLAAQRENWNDAARFCGAAERQAGDTGIHRDPADDAFVTRWMTKARTALEEPAFAASQTSGHALTYEQSIADARAWLAGHEWDASR